MSTHYEYRRFTSYEDLAEFSTTAQWRDWFLQHWQDVSGDDGIDIRALFQQNATKSSHPLHTVEDMKREQAKGSSSKV